jgi:hypothetical protein
MCAALMQPEKATTEELKAAIERKYTKFGSAEKMPQATWELVVAGRNELIKRGAA